MNLDPNVMTEYFYDDEKKAIIVCKYRAKECLFCSNKEQTIYFKKFYICMPCIQSLPALQVFLERVERERANELKKTLSNKKKITARRKETLKRLHQVMKENPEASQRKIAKILGVSQAWVSHLLRHHVDS
ncbi:regulator [Paenibacillus ehimensis]|uniref:regulator n=1 Tax=Paenibacillus ehimensis TaxID=79264 RepID=UPI0027D7E204|nr:regulator [Paenibacillus ehimensis]